MNAVTSLNTAGGGGGRFFRVRPEAKVSAVEPGEVLRNQFINKCLDMISGVFGYVVSTVADLVKKSIHRVLPIKELPQVDAGGAQAKAITGIRVEQNGPVIELFPEHNEGVGSGFIAVFHADALTFPSNISPDRATLIDST